MRSTLDILSEEVLTQLELKESSMLSWGFISGYLNVHSDISEVLSNPPTSMIRDYWEEHKNNGGNIDTIIKNLTERKLLFLRSDGLGKTRYAEAIRLLYQLKQRFSFEDWASAPNLVSNIRLAPKYRRYPKRDMEWAKVRDYLIDKGICNQFTGKIIDLLLDTGTSALNLSNFQVQSIETIISNAISKYDRAVIIGAGTGSGKTKAFYLPAISLIGEDIRKDDSYYTRVIAIYPRNELLKDQYKEALSEVLKLNSYFEQNNLRTITVGAYNGDIPPKALDIIDNEFYKWEKRGKGYVCPSLLCPKCGSNMIWREEDLNNEIDDNSNNRYGRHEILHCEDSNCGIELSRENIVLTRRRMQIAPPDILFTTTEMLNKKLFDTSDQHIFGINTAKTPSFVLLDEVHINEGVLGAHVAYLLRRWRNLIRINNPAGRVQFVGLSATLTEPKVFFSNLVGIDENYTSYITPEEEDLVEEGMEYNMVLRGDPISEKSLLSTSVQTAMLAARILDPLNASVSKGAYGSKIFAFTDKLDVINRWYHIEKDAESEKKLSALRDPALAMDRIPQSIKSMHENGQIWRIAKDIDERSLKTPLKIGVTSSQSKGVDTDAKLVIATSTLEVGFNDPDVGAVIQHKAPRNIASFLQRKGRAGRKRGMRPWTIVVTSAYGRDRWAYENYEQLFSPVLTPLNLPVKNIYVQHIQAAFALMDWLSHILNRKGFKNVNMGRLLMQSKNKDDLAVKEVAYNILTDVLSGNYQGLQKFIKDSLRLDLITLDRVMWMPPRSIMMDLIPYITAQLSVNWGRVIRNNKVETKNLDIETYALSGYVPRNLFSNLEVNDIKLVIPGRDPGKSENMTLKQGMMEFAPGNVSKRFADLKNKKSAHWVPVENDTLVITDNENMVLQKVGAVNNDEGKVTVYLPKVFRLQELPKNLSDRTSGFPLWKFEMLPNAREVNEDNRGAGLRIQNCAYLGQIIDNMEVFSSDNNQGVLCTRYYNEVDVQLKDTKGQTTSKRVSLKSASGDAALGFRNYVDAIGIRYKTFDIKDIRKSPDIGGIVKELRPKFYINEMKNDELIKSMLSVFEIDWMCQICLASVTAVSISSQSGIKEAIEIYKGNLKKISERTLTAIFQTVSLDEQDDDMEGGKLAKRLLQYVETKSVIDRFIEKMEYLYSDVTILEEFWNWVWDKYIATIASAFKTAVDEMLPDTNTEDLIIDIDGKNEVIWISEPDSGGVGIVSNVASAINKYPGKFEEYFVNTIRFCRQHEIADALDTISEDIENPLIEDSFRSVRDSNTLDEQKEALEKVQKSMYRMGIPPTNELVVMVMSKVLNNNSDSSTDMLVKRISSMWKMEEERLNCSIGLRTFSVACIQVDNLKSEIDSILAKVCPGTKINEKQRFALIESMLWSDCRDSCPDCLQIYNSFSRIIEPSRLIMGQVLSLKDEIVKYGSKGWKSKVNKLLSDRKVVRVVGDSSVIDEMKKDIMELVLTPIDTGFELFYPVIRGARVSSGKYIIDLFVREDSDE